MPFVHENVKVELFPGTPSPIVYLSQNDVGDTIVFELVYKGQPVNVPNNSVVKFKGTKKDGLGFTVNSSNVSGNVVSFVVSGDMTSCSGVVESEISITLSNNKHGTCNVVLIVEKSPHSDGTQDGSYPQIVSEMRELVNQIEGDAETASNAADIAVAAKNSALEIQQDVHQYTADSINDWLDEHPEATTTVQDGAITEVKFSDALKLKTIKDYVTPEMFGAVGDGVSDDSNYVAAAVAHCLQYGKTLVGVNSYYIDGVMDVSNINIDFTMATIITTGGVVVNGSRDKIIKLGTIEAYGIQYGNYLADAVGLIIKNCSTCRIFVLNITHFEVGVALDADGAGTAYNICEFLLLYDNLISVRLNPVNSGYVTENKFFGGRWTVTNSFINNYRPSIRLISIGSNESGTGLNNNIFVAVCLEGNIDTKISFKRAPNNMFLGCRWEGTSVISSDRYSSSNVFIGGVYLENVDFEDEAALHRIVIVNSDNVNYLQNLEYKVSGKDLSNMFSSGKLSQQIAAGNFERLCLGDYIPVTLSIDFENSGIATNYDCKVMIVDFDPYFSKAYTAGARINKHHIGCIVTDLPYLKMNDTADTTGGYMASKMHTTYLPKVLAALEIVLGSSHLLAHQKYYSNNAGSAGSTNAEFVSNQYISLLTEAQVVGSAILGNRFDIGEGYRQLAAFSLTHFTNIIGAKDIWLRTVGSGSHFEQFLQTGIPTVAAANATRALVPLILLI